MSSWAVSNRDVCPVLCMRTATVRRTVFGVHLTFERDCNPQRKRTLFFSKPMSTMFKCFNVLRTALLLLLNFARHRTIVCEKKKVPFSVFVYTHNVK